jgi:hypothetical protein
VNELPKTNIEILFSDGSRRPGPEWMKLSRFVCCLGVDSNGEPNGRGSLELGCKQNLPKVWDYLQSEAENGDGEHFVEPIGLIIPVYYQKFGGLAECWATWSFPDTEYLKNGIGYRWDEDEEDAPEDIILTVIKVKKKGELH